MTTVASLRPVREDADVLISTSEAALLASWDVDEVLAAVIRGELPAVRVGDGVRVSRPALVATLRARRGLRDSMRRAA